MQAINNLSKDAFKFNKINNLDSSRTPFRKEIFMNKVSFSYDEKRVKIKFNIRKFELKNIQR